MGRHYAGILASIALTVIVIRGLVHGAGFVSTLEAAAICTVLLFVIGFVVGHLASWIVLESVRVAMAAEQAAQPASPRPVRP